MTYRLVKCEMCGKWYYKPMNCGDNVCSKCLKKIRELLGIEDD